MSNKQVIVDQRKESIAYMEKHKVLKLFDILGAKLAKEKPDDPNEFLVKEIEKIMQSKALNEPVTLFSEKDIELLFSVFDITNRGYVNPIQYEKALEAVGIKNPIFPIPKEEQINKGKFVSQIYQEVLQDSY